MFPSNDASVLNSANSETEFNNNKIKELNDNNDCINSEATTLVDFNNSRSNNNLLLEEKSEYGVDSLILGNESAANFFEQSFGVYKKDNEMDSENINCHLNEIKSDNVEINPLNTFDNNNTDDTDEEDEEDDASPKETDDFGYEPEYVVELESWLAFKGTFDSMQALTRLRFKFMSYFLNVLKNPSRETSTENLVIY